MGIVIRNGRLIDPANQLDQQADLYIENGCISSIGAAPEGFTTDQTIDAGGCIVMPGIVDLMAHLREPGQEHKGTIASETRAAAAGGITTVCMPPDTNPVIDTPAVVKQIQQLATAAGFAKVLPLGALTRKLDGEHLSEMQTLKDTGCVALSNTGKPILSTLVKRRTLEYAATLGMTVFITAEDPWLAGNGCVHDGTVSTRLGLAGIPECAEVIAISRDLALIEQTGVKAHFSQISSARSVERLAEARAHGLQVTADVSAAHLHLTEMDVGFFNSMCHLRPPLRTLRDRDGLRNAVASGLINVICSDHQPHDRDAKLAPFAATEAGASGLETLLPLTLRLAEDGVMTLSDAVARLTSQPAAVLGIEAGTLSPGRSADICIVDPDKYWTVSELGLLSRGKNTPFLGWELKGKVRYTLLDGVIVHQES